MHLLSMMLRDGKAAISPSEGPDSKTKLCLCSLKTFISSEFVCICSIGQSLLKRQNIAIYIIKS